MRARGGCGRLRRQAVLRRGTHRADWSRASPLRRVWARREYATVQAVRTFVKKLCRKIDDDSTGPPFIHNVRGVGYRMPKPGEPLRHGHAGMRESYNSSASELIAYYR